MSSWAERVHRRAADFGSVVTSCGHPGSSASAYPYRLEKVKFGVPLEEVCKNDNIPGPLLVLILKLDKESPNRRDVFRAPGHQGAMKKLIHFLQAGRLVNVDNYSVYTIASVLKKFLRKIPNGVFGRTGERELFAIIELENETEQNERLHRLFTSLPKYTQHLLVLLFGTFRVIASNAAHAGTGMTSEALGVSVAPSFFQSCVSDGKTARMEDVLKFKVATKIMKHIIDKFATHDLFGRNNYEYYARVTGRILKVQDEWICSFQYPPPPRGKLAQQKYALQHSLEAEKTWLQCQCERWGLLAQEESRSTPALLTSSSSALDNSALSLGVTPEHSFIESCARLSVSLEGPSLFAMTSSPIPKRGEHERLLQRGVDVGEYEDDEENYADDDADDDEEDFAAELEISNDDDIENNPKANLLKMTTSRKQRPTTSSTEGARSLEHDDLDNDDAEVIFVKRRYRQNRKKMTQTRMQQRRLRTCSKSLDGSEHPHILATSAAHNENGAGCNGGNSTTKTKMSVHSTAAAAGGGVVKTRTCSRCNRGIRHSSSCSSASASGAGGAANNGSAMTMEELRAVNRYAESTKSLSYLPQVHERQTARMRTRSEWFLGPKDAAAVSLQLPNTCSNCCLVLQGQQQQQQRQHNEHAYLGGGSTRDMRMQRTIFFGLDLNANACGTSGETDAEDDGRDASGPPLMYLYPRRQQQQQPHQQLYMDTDDNCLASDTSQQQQQHIPPNTTRAFLTPTQPRITADGTTHIGGSGSNSRHLFLDTSTVGNIRLSNSAESVQYPARRPPSRRFIGINVPRQYPLRASLRRNKEKQIGSSGNNLGSLDLGSNQPPSVRNSIAECCGNISSMHHGSSGNILMPTFPHNRLQTRATSVEHKQQTSYMDAEDNSGLMDTIELTKTVAAAPVTAGSSILLYTTTATNKATTPASITGAMVKNLENLAASQKQQQQQQQLPPQKSDETAVSSTITFKAPRI